MSGQGGSGQMNGNQGGGYGQSQYGQYPGQMGGGYGGMGNYGASQNYGSYGGMSGGQYNPQSQYGGGQNYRGGGMQQPSQGWSGGPNMSGGYSQPAQGSGQTSGLWNGGMPAYSQMGQQSQYVGSNTPIGLNTPGQSELRQTGGAMPPQQPSRLNSTQILMDRARAVQQNGQISGTPNAMPVESRRMSYETPPYAPPVQAQPQTIQPPQQTVAPPPQQSYQQQWQAQLKAAQDQLNLGPAQYGQQPKADDGTGNYRDENGNYYLETAPSTLDPGSMAGLQAWLGGSNSPFGTTVPQQQQGYLDYYRQQHPNGVPGVNNYITPTTNYLTGTR